MIVGVLTACIEVGAIENALSPRTGERANLLYGLVFAEVAAFYALASIFGGLLSSDVGQRWIPVVAGQDLVGTLT